MTIIRATGSRHGLPEILWLSDPVQCQFTAEQASAHVFEAEAEARAVIDKMNSGFGYQAGPGFKAERFELWAAGIAGSE